MTGVCLSGQDSYHTYLISELVRAGNGELLAICEGRRVSDGDADVEGTNVLAVYANAAYLDGGPVGQVDIRLEGLKKAE